VAVDIADSTDPRRTVPHKLAMHEGLHNILKQAFAEAETPLQDCEVADRGDGALIFVPIRFPQSLIADRLLTRIHVGLLRHNAVYSAEARIHLRLAVHVGEVPADSLRRQAYLAVDMRKAGNHAAALEMSKDALDRFLIRYGWDNFNVMACALAYSIDLRHAGRHREARKFGEEMVERYRRNLGEDHPFTWCSTVDLAVTMRLLGEPAAARSLDERAFERLRVRLGPDHSLAIIAAINLASDSTAVGDTDTAITIGTEVLERSERTLGVDHPTTLAASLNLSFDLRQAGRENEAGTRYVDVLSRYRRVLGEQHPATVTAAKGVRANCDIDPLPL
jgi:hypothetical protein